MFHYLFVVMGLDNGIPDSVEHTHEDGTIHTHVDGQAPHTHEEGARNCICEENERNRGCRLHGG